MRLQNNLIHQKLCFIMSLAHISATHHFQIKYYQLLWAQNKDVQIFGSHNIITNYEQQRARIRVQVLSFPSFGIYFPTTQW